MGPSSITPALLTSVSRRPNSPTVRSTMARADGLVGDVGLDHQHVGVGPDPLGQRLEAVPAAGGDGHGGPLGGQGHGGGLTDAARCPGDDGHRSLQGRVMIYLRCGCRHVDGPRRHHGCAASTRRQPGRVVTGPGWRHGSGVEARGAPGRPAVYRGESPGADQPTAVPSAWTPGGRPVRRRSASSTSPSPCAWPTIGCAVGPAAGSTCRRASDSPPGSRGARTSRCCCTSRAAPGTRAGYRPGRLRRPRGDCSPPARQPRKTRPLPVACQPCCNTPSSSRSLQ